jgi:hypothetical protein
MGNFSIFSAAQNSIHSFRLSFSDAVSLLSQDFQSNRSKTSVILNNEKLLFNTNTQQTTNRQTMALETVPSCAIDEEEP